MPEPQDPTRADLARARRPRALAPRSRALALLAALGLLLPFLVLGPASATDAVLSDHAVRSAEGAEVSIDLLEGSQGVAENTTRLLLDGLPASSTLSADGRRAVIPGQGTWTVTDRGRTATFTPSGGRIGRQPSPVLYTAQDAAGQEATPAVLTIITPVIADLIRSAPYGQVVELPLASAQENVQPASLRLVVPAGEAHVELSEDATRATVPGQGTWELDRAAQTVRFTPASAEVRAVAPMGVQGSDEQGEAATPGLLRIGYPGLFDRVIAAQPRTVVQFTPMDGSRSVRADSLRLQVPSGSETMPEGTVLREDGLRLEVPGQGIWTLDPAARTVTFAPESDDPDSPSPVDLSATGLYGDNATTARLSVQYADAPPTARDDQLWSRPGQAVAVDLLGDDSAGRTSQPLDPASVRLRSLDAANLSELDHGEGTRIVIPGEGAYQVRSDGVLTFTPADGFVGRATPIEYTVSDRSGLVAEAEIAVDIDPDAAPPADRSEESSGIAGVLRNLLPDDRPTFAVFATVAALLTFAGLAALWIGGRMEIDRRRWKD